MLIYNNSEFETLEKKQIELKKSLVEMTDHMATLSNKIDEVRADMNRRMDFFRSTLQSHICSGFAHNADNDQLSAMLVLVENGKASLTVSYNLYPIEKEDDNHA